MVAASALLDRYGNAIRVIEQDGFEIKARVYMVLEGENLVTSAKSTGIGLSEIATVLDNIEPDDVSKKSLRVLDKKLQHLRDHATFDVNINSVLGGGIKNAEDARTINKRARELGFSTSIGIIHDGSGLLKPLAQLLP